MDFWDRIQKDMGKNLKEGLQTIKSKAGELTDEGKRKYKVYDLQSQIHKLMAELGAAVYAQKGSSKNPSKTPKVTALFGRIAKLEEKLLEIEGGKSTKKAAKKNAKKKPVKKKTKKKVTKKSAKKA